MTYGYNRSLWHDEASLALNIINDVNFFQPLLHNQFAPQIFMYITKLNTYIFGCNEMVLRFIPFIFGILSVFMFYFLSKEFLEKKVSILLANALFAVNYHIIYYCQEFKQYSTDVFFFMLFLLILSKFDITKMNIKSYFAFGVLIIFSTMISLPILFLISSWIVMEIIKYKINGLKKSFTFIPFFIVLFLYYIFVLSSAKYNVDLYNVHFWDSGYIKFNLFFMLNMIKNSYNYCFSPNNDALVLFLISFTGWYLIIKRMLNKDIYLLSFISFIFVLVASSVKLYPIDGRAGLFFTPVVLLTVAAVVDKIKWNYLVLIFILISLSSYNFGYFKSFCYQNVFTYKNVREITRILKEKYVQGDIVIYNIASQPDYEYYTKFFDLNIKDYAILQLPSVNDKEKMVVLNESLSYLKKGKNYIFYIGYDWKKRPELYLIKQWIHRKPILWEYEVNGSYIANILW